uniref:F-box protein 36 n=1 Tax=Salvator merianae TaxID=96440 RepID=A0A8D0DS91_SALMN
MKTFWMTLLSKASRRWSLHHHHPYSAFEEESVCLLQYVQIAIVFGGETLEHTFNMCRGNFDFLVRLPDPLLLYIISYLDLEDIARLSQVSRRLEMLCNSEKLWEMTVENLTGKITPEMRTMAQDVGWKQFFFTNKVQLQRRRAKKHDSDESLSD